MRAAAGAGRSSGSGGSRVAIGLCQRTHSLQLGAVGLPHSLGATVPLGSRPFCCAFHTPSMSHSLEPFLLFSCFPRMLPHTHSLAPLSALRLSCSPQQLPSVFPAAAASTCPSSANVHSQPNLHVCSLLYQCQNVTVCNTEQIGEQSTKVRRTGRCASCRIAKHFTAAAAWPAPRPPERPLPCAPAAAWPAALAAPAAAAAAGAAPAA